MEGEDRGNLNNEWYEPDWPMTKGRRGQGMANSKSQNGKWQRLYGDSARPPHDPSFFGGKIIGVEIVHEGPYQGRVLFRFTYSANCRGVKTGRSGRAQEMKIV